MSTVGEDHVIRVLMVEDDPDHQLLVEGALSAVRVARFELAFSRRLREVLGGQPRRGARPEDSKP